MKIENTYWMIVGGDLETKVPVTTEFVYIMEDFDQNVKFIPIQNMQTAYRNCYEQIENLRYNLKFTLESIDYYKDNIAYKREFRNAEHEAESIKRKITVIEDFLRSQNQPLKELT